MGEGLSRFAYVHVAPDLAMMGRTYSEAASGLMPAEPVLVIGQPTAIDPSRAPSGKAILWVQVRMAPAAILGDAKGEIEVKEWDDAKDRTPNGSWRFWNPTLPDCALKSSAARSYHRLI